MFVSKRCTSIICYASNLYFYMCHIQIRFILEAEMENEDKSNMYIKVVHIFSNLSTLMWLRVVGPKYCVHKQSSTACTSSQFACMKQIWASCFSLLNVRSCHLSRVSEHPVSRWQQEWEHQQNWNTSIFNHFILPSAVKTEEMMEFLITVIGFLLTKLWFGKHFCTCSSFIVHVVTLISNGNIHVKYVQKCFKILSQRTKWVVKLPFKQ